MSGLLIEKTSVKEDEVLGGFALNSLEGDWGLEKSASLNLYFVSKEIHWLYSLSAI